MAYDFRELKARMKPEFHKNFREYYPVESLGIPGVYREDYPGIDVAYELCDLRSGSVPGSMNVYGLVGWGVDVEVLQPVPQPCLVEYHLVVERFARSTDIRAPLWRGQVYQLVEVIVVQVNQIPGRVAPYLICPDAVEEMVQVDS